MQGNNYQIDKEPLLQIPIYQPDFQNPSEKSLHDKIVKNVETILALHTANKFAATEQLIQYLENQIDTWVMDLYGLSASERELL